MLKITPTQIRAFDAAALEDFLSKVEQFLRSEAPAEMSRIADPGAFVNAAYRRATVAGHKTERDLVRYMLDELNHTSSQNGR